MTSGWIVWLATFFPHQMPAVDTPLDLHELVAARLGRTKVTATARGVRGGVFGCDATELGVAAPQLDAPLVLS